MMKRFFTLLLCVIVVVLAQAGNVTPEEAQAKAEAFMKARHATIKRQTMKLARRAKQQKQNEAAAYYVFNTTDNNGFVIVSGDDRTPAILGYADNGTFDNSNVPENMQVWLDEYARQIDFLSTHPTASVATASTENREAVSPLLTTKWNQEAPYNLLCPMDEGKPSYTGCVATAMAQILAYHKYPARTTNVIPAYTTSTKKIFVDSIPPTDFDWANMLDTYTGEETEAQNLAVATLMKICGASLKMDYTQNGSGSYVNECGEVLKNYFDYDAGTFLAKRTDYSTEKWDNMIYNELVHNRPVCYAGISIIGGHAVVIDGYDGNGLFHVNWGWGGNSNGYFLLSVLNSDQENDIDAPINQYSFSYSQYAIIGAQPNTGNPAVGPQRVTTNNIWLKETTILKDETNSFNITLKYKLTNISGAPVSFYGGTGVYNTDNEMVYKKVSDNVLTLKFAYYVLKNEELSIPALPDGYYYIVPISREVGTETWVQNNNSYKYYLIAHIEGDTLTLTVPTVDLSAKMEPTTSVEIGNTIKFNTTITNNGKLFREDIFLLVNGEQKAGCLVELAAGDTKTVKMSYTPEEVGTDSLSLGFYYSELDENNRPIEYFKELASTTITVTPVLSHSLTFSDAQVLNANEKNIFTDYADIIVNVANTGTNNYYNDLKTCVYKYNEDSETYKFIKNVLTPVSIDAGMTKSVRINVSGLDDGLYWFTIVYKSDGKFNSIDDEDSCCNLVNYTISVPSTIETTTANVQMPASVIFDLQGRRVQNPQKGLYIKNGRKVVIK